jgi:hypothetical protein
MKQRGYKEALASLFGRCAEMLEHTTLAQLCGGDLLYVLLHGHGLHSVEAVQFSMQL